MNEIILGNPISIPIYNFEISRREDESLIINPAKVIIIEGIYAFYDKVEILSWYNYI